MKFGLNVWINDTRKTANYAQLAEEAGWDGLFVGDAIWTVDPIVTLTAAAMTTNRIRLGTYVIPMPLRRPWKVASETAALDNLSGGRLILGLGTGAVWMGWQAFPDEVTDIKARAEMLDEGIDILTLLYRGKQFDYDGKHYHVKLTYDEKHYPPPPLQSPRIPIWVVGAWPRMKSMKRVLKCDGLIPLKMNPKPKQNNKNMQEQKYAYREGKFEEVLPVDIRDMKAFVDTNRTLSTPFDIVVGGKTMGLDRAQMQDKLYPWIEAGATWWMENLLEESEDRILKRIRQGPPQFE